MCAFLDVIYPMEIATKRFMLRDFVELDRLDYQADPRSQIFDEPAKLVPN